MQNTKRIKVRGRQQRDIDASLLVQVLLSISEDLAVPELAEVRDADGLDSDLPDREESA